MKLFACQFCGQVLHFENTKCERCGRALGYLPDRTVLSALEPGKDGPWRALAAPHVPVNRCANAVHDVCNWMVPADGPNAWCPACRLNRTVPNLDKPANLLLWRRLEAAKHRLVYGLLRLGLPLESKLDDAVDGLAFDFLEAMDGLEVVTGHKQGLITIDIAEADPAERERHRETLIESYRTLLGHFRHETGHYYWDRLVRDGPWHDGFRDIFGDERADYGAALADHYAEGPPPDWGDHFISAYATSHPWEDFAETWAHYLHMADTLETAAAYGLRTGPKAGSKFTPGLLVDVDAYGEARFDVMVEAWLPLTSAVNSLNQSMGQPDLYPFVLSPPVIGKLRFVHGLVHGTSE